MSRRLSMTATVLAVLSALGACGVDGSVLFRGASAPGLDDPDDGPPIAGDSSTSSAVYAVFASQDFSCALLASRAYCWGRNSVGALGVGDTQARLEPAAVATSALFSTLALGENHTCGIEQPSRRVLCWGSGGNGQLGSGRDTNELTPVLVNLPGPVTALTAGYNHVCAIVEPGELYCWGENAEGEIGLEPAVDVPTVLSPVRVGAERDWIAVSGGQGHTCGLRSPGALYCWGRNNHYELGLGFLDPGQIRTVTRVGTTEDDIQIDLGQSNAASITRDGRVRRWGDPTGAETYVFEGLTTPTFTNGFTEIAAMSTDVFTTCAVSTSGRLFCLGRNIEGQFGAGTNDYQPNPVESPPPAPGVTYLSVSVGRFHTCTMATDRLPRCAGWNDLGQLGVGNTNGRNVQTPVKLEELTR
jgi:alpha-tubulin suppressor-like RCC1 family protein